MPHRMMAAFIDELEKIAAAATNGKPLVQSPVAAENELIREQLDNIALKQQLKQTMQALQQQEAMEQQQMQQQMQMQQQQMQMQQQAQQAQGGEQGQGGEQAQGGQPQQPQLPPGIDPRDMIGGAE